MFFTFSSVNLQMDGNVGWLKPYYTHFHLSGLVDTCWGLTS